MSDVIWGIDFLVAYILLAVMFEAPSNRVAVMFFMVAIPGVMHEWGWL